MATMTAPKGGPAQTVGRAIALLKLVASSRSQQLRLVDLADLAGLEKSTAHRLLQRLEQEGMLVRDGKTGYRVGPLAYELGLAARPDSDLHEVSQPALNQLARSTGEMIFLVKRSGFQTVCLDRIDGDFPIRTLTRGIGDRHPLGAGAGGMAILAAMNDRELDFVTPRLAAPLAPYGHKSRCAARWRWRGNGAWRWTTAWLRPTSRLLARRYTTGSARQSAPSSSPVSGTA
jgi:DNA-binding IclR family transcriptional regulator